MEAKVESRPDPERLGAALSDAEWSRHNERRCALIEKDRKEGLSLIELSEFEWLQKLAWARRNAVNPILPGLLERLQITEDRLRAEGKWDE